MNHHIIAFKTWDDYVKGLSIAGYIDTVECRSDRIIIITDRQLESIKRSGVKYENR